MWIETLLDKLTSFIPRPIVIKPDEGGFRQTPKPWAGWPWNKWPWIRKEWLKHPWKGKPWSDNKDSTNTWIVEMKPGNWCWLIPLFMEHMVTPIKTQVKDIRIQSAWTKDGKDVAIGVTIQYYVSNPMKAILEVYDYDESIQNIVLGIVSDYIENHTEEELRNSRKNLLDELLKATRDAAGGWGLKIQTVKISDIGRTNNFRILMDDRIGFKVSE